MINLGKIIALTLVIAVAVASPVAAGSRPNDSTTYKLYRGGVSTLERTEGLISGVLKGTFSLFNPCLDVVKGCTSIVLAPIEYPFTYLSQSKKRVATKRSKVPVPKKPELPKQ
jgi:hypothetical protein